VSFASQIKNGRWGVNSPEDIIFINLSVRIYLTQASDKQRLLSNTVMSLRVPENAGKLRDLVNGSDLHEPELMHEVSLVSSLHSAP
jgi:hypothetical protein